jgi:hypothetical protein
MNTGTETFDRYNLWNLKELTETFRQLQNFRTPQFPGIFETLGQIA